MSTKKSFSEDLNPALAFIDVGTPGESDPVSSEELSIVVNGVESADPELVQKEFSQEQVRKNFADNPLSLLLRHHQPETKSRRVQMLLRPSTYDRLKKQARRANISVNAYVNAILEYYTENYSEKDIL